MSKKTPFRLASLLLLAAILPRPVAGQEESALARARAALPAAAAAELDATVRDAQQRGLPVEPLVDKALEGAAKGVAPDRILAVVRSLEADLDRALGLLRAGGYTAAQSPVEVAGVADALRRGVPGSALAALAKADGNTSISLEAHVLADLLAAGVPVNAALEVISAWRGHGHDPGQLQELPAAVEREVRGGTGPAEAAAEIAARVRAGQGPLMRGPPEVPPGVGKKKGSGPPLPPGSGPPTTKGKKKHGGSGG